MSAHSWIEEKGAKAWKIDFQFSEEVELFPTFELLELLALFELLPGLKNQSEHGGMFGFGSESVIWALHQIR